MLYTINRDIPDFLYYGIFDAATGNMSEVVVSETSTEIVFTNTSNGATVTITGTGLEIVENGPDLGTVNSITVSDNDGTIGSITQIAWSFEDFGEALNDWEDDDYQLFANLVNAGTSLTINASQTTDRLDIEAAFEEIAPLITVGLTYVDSPFDVNLIGTSGNDTFLFDGSDDLYSFVEVEATDGNDTFDATNISDLTFVFLDYDQDYTQNPGAVTVTVNGQNNTASIVGPNSTDTITAVNGILTGDGLAISGSSFDDTFDITQRSNGWIVISGGEGVDDFDLTLANNSTILLSFNDGANDEPDQGLVMDLGQGTISNDGFGNVETFSLTNNGGRLEVRGTDNDDNITGSSNNDVIRATGGDDTINGNGGFDFVRFDDRNFIWASIDLENGEAIAAFDGDEYDYDLTSVEDLRGTRDGHDALLGDDAHNYLAGRGGNDLLNGRGGNDYLQGDAGNDTFIGGAGDDTASIDDDTSNITIYAVTGGLVINSQDGSDFVSDDIETVDFNDTSATYATLAGFAAPGSTVTYAITGDNASFAGYVLNPDDGLELNANRTATQFTYDNLDNGSSVRVAGSGFTYTNGQDVRPDGGTITSLTFLQGNTQLGAITGASIDYFDFEDALNALGQDDYTAFAQLFNRGARLIVDATGATGDLNDYETSTDFAFSVFSDALTGIEYRAGPNSDRLIGTASDDLFIFEDAGQGDRPYFSVRATDGNDVYDFSNADTEIGIGIDYDQAEAIVGKTPIIVTLDANLNSGIIEYGNQSDTITNVARAMDDEGLDIGGTQQDDDFEIETVNGSWVAVAMRGGDDTLTATLASDSTLRLDFSDGGGEDIFSGIDIDLGLGEVSNDGMGGEDELNITGSGRVEVRGTSFADSMVGSAGRDRFLGTAGDDTYEGGAGYDWMRYNRGDIDRVVLDLNLGSATATSNGIEYVHTLSGIGAAIGTRNGLDEYYGDDFGNDFQGSDNDNIIDGRGGEDVIEGNGGSDTITGGFGNDTLSGGDGDDVFIMASGDGDDVITDFENTGAVGTGDKIDVSDYGIAFGAISFTQEQNGLRVHLSNDSILLEGVSGTALDAADFLFESASPAAPTTSSDFNADGTDDILWRNTNGAVTIFNIDDSARDGVSGLGRIGTAWEINGVGDFNADGTEDILFRHTDGRLTVWSIDDSDRSDSNGLTRVATDWSIAGIGDFDADGTDDILWRNDNGAVSIWTMDDADREASTGVGRVSNDWSIAGVGDFDGDGTDDILWRNDTSGAVSVWTINAAGREASTGVGRVSTAWDVEGVGDFNGDGTDDILWRNDQGTVSIWEIDGTARSGGSNLGRVGPQWEIEGVGDFNADGTDDILWRNNNGFTSIWDIDDSARVASNSLGQVANAWSIDFGMTGEDPLG